MRIGLLEDDVAIQEMLLLVLQDEGYTATNYSSAEVCLEALTTASQESVQPPVDLLIIDWRLNGALSGIEVIRQIRMNNSPESLPIILTTAAAFHNVEELKYLQAAFLEKPFSIDEITVLIKGLTQSHTLAE